MTVRVYATTHIGIVTSDQPMPHHVQAGRVVPVRLNYGPLRFCDPDDLTRAPRRVWGVFPKEES